MCEKIIVWFKGNRLELDCGDIWEGRIVRCSSHKSSHEDRVTMFEDSLECERDDID